MVTPVEEYDRALTRLAEDEVSMMVRLRRVLLTFGIVILATLAISQAEADELRRQLEPLERAMSDSNWIALDSEWRALASVLSTYGGEYAQAELEPWWELALASQLGSLHLQQMIGSNPRIDTTVETISEFARRLSYYNRSVRRLSTRAAAGTTAGELDAIDMRMLDTLRLVSDDDSLLSAQSITILKTAVVLDELARDTVLPSWFGGRLPEVLAAGRQRLENDDTFETFGTFVLAKDLRTSQELDRVSPNYLTLITHLQRVDHPNAASAHSKIREIRSAIRKHEETAVSVPGVGVRIPFRYISIAALAVNLTVLLLAVLAMRRLLGAVRAVEAATSARVAIRIAQHRLPWLRRNAAWPRALATLTAVAPILALLVVQTLDSAASTASIAPILLIGAAVLAATWFSSLAAARTMEHLTSEPRAFQAPV